MNAVRLVHPAIESILVRSDGYWRLPPPICLDLPPDIDQWQPIVGPLTEPVTQAFESMAMVRNAQESSRRFSLTPVPGSGNGGQPHPDWSAVQSNNQLAKPQSNTCMPTRNKLSSMVPSVPITPSKETTCSSPWHHGSDSPSVMDRMSGSLADQRTVEGSTGSKPPSVSRPSSQPSSTSSSASFLTDEPPTIGVNIRKKNPMGFQLTVITEEFTMSDIMSYLPVTMVAFSSSCFEL
ncbi:hypothetical protein AHF37_08556 [Paragonimus kellicotti]|nr:hypothetical protein AHF37_08556 [Paragonimus kellicotti]